MGNTQVAFRLDDGLLRKLDELAEKEGVSRTQIVEQLLDRGVEDELEFVRNMEKPLERLLSKALISSGIAGVLLKAGGKELDPRRARLAREGLAGGKRGLRAVKGAES